MKAVDNQIISTGDALEAAGFRDRGVRWTIGLFDCVTYVYCSTDLSIRYEIYDKVVFFYAGRGLCVQTRHALLTHFVRFHSPIFYNITHT